MTDGDAGRQSIILFGIHLTARAVGFLGLVYFARVLPPEELGAYFLFFTVVQLSSLMSNLGVTSAAVKRISEGEDTDGVFSASVTIATAASVAVAVLVFVFRGYLADYIGLDVPVFIVVAVGLWLVADVLVRSLQGEDRVLTSGAVQLLQDVLRVGVGAVLITLGYGAVGLIWGVIAGFAATVVVAYPLLNVSLRIPLREHFSRIFSISRYTMFYGPTNLVYFWFDTLMIGLFLTRPDVSAYEVAWQTTRVMIIATYAINQTVFPKISKHATKGDTDEVSRLLSGAVLFTLFFPLPGLVGIAVLGEEILSVVYRPEYAVAAVPMTLLAGYMVVESIQRVVNSTLVGLERPELPFRSRMVGVTLALVLNAALIPTVGLVGAAVATVVAKFVDTAIQWYYVADVVELRIPKRSIAWETVSALIMGGVVYAVARVLSPRRVPSLVAVVALGAVVYGVLVLLDEDIRDVFSEYVPLPSVNQ
ncbi:MAG: flippase [Halobacteria archaeon]|nr:flippase [Halobacteria archaeon]